MYNNPIKIMIYTHKEGYMEHMTHTLTVERHRQLSMNRTFYVNGELICYLPANQKDFQPNDEFNVHSKCSVH